MTGGHPAFLKAMATNALDVSPPLGKIRDFVTDDDPKHPGTIDLQEIWRPPRGCCPVLALRTGVEATSTAQRLRQGGSRIGMPAEELAAMADGFHFIQDFLRLRHPAPRHRPRRPGRQPRQARRPQRNRPAHPQRKPSARPARSNSDSSWTTKSTMNWLSRFLPGGGPRQPPFEAELDAVATLPAPEITCAHYENRYVIVNAESP